MPMPTVSHAEHVRGVFSDAALARRYGRDRFPRRRHEREVRVLSKLLPELGPGPRLDLACGAGRFGRVVAAGGVVYGADASAAMLHEARATGEYRALTGADARRLPFRSAAFGAAVCIRLLQHLDADDRRAVLSELRRVVAGRVVVSFFDSGTLEALRARFRRRDGERSRRAISVAAFTADCAAAGWRVARLERKLGRLTEHVFALLSPLDAAPVQGRT